MKKADDTSTTGTPVADETEIGATAPKKKKAPTKAKAAPKKAAAEAAPEPIEPQQQPQQQPKQQPKQQRRPQQKAYKGKGGRKYQNTRPFVGFVGWGRHFRPAEIGQAMRAKGALGVKFQLSGWNSKGGRDGWVLLADRPLPQHGFVPIVVRGRGITVVQKSGDLFRVVDSQYAVGDGAFGLTLSVGGEATFGLSKPVGDAVVIDRHWTAGKEPPAGLEEVAGVLLEQAMKRAAHLPTD